MKKCFLIVIFLSFCFGVSENYVNSTVSRNESKPQPVWYQEFLRHDRLDHMVYSALIYKVLQDQKWQQNQIVISTATVGLLKEIYDQFYGSGFDWWDFTADMLGIWLGQTI